MPGETEGYPFQFFFGIVRFFFKNIFNVSKGSPFNLLIFCSRIDV